MADAGKVVICGAGIAGIAAAYQLAVIHGRENVTLVEPGNPLSVTSDKSTEAYRNWWPGPDWAMTAFMNRSIDLIEEIARARRAGWLSAQQLGMAMLEAARERGAKLLRGRVVGIDTAGGRVRAVEVERDGKRQQLEATHVVLAAGPMQNEMARLIGVDLPMYAERHHKLSFADTQSAVPRAAPMMIWLDAQHLPWSDE